MKTRSEITSHSSDVLLDKTSELKHTHTLHPRSPAAAKSSSEKKHQRACRSQVHSPALPTSGPRLCKTKAAVCAHSMFEVKVLAKENEHTPPPSLPATPSASQGI
jgi:hypothetical protein